MEIPIVKSVCHSGYEIAQEGGCTRTLVPGIRYAADNGAHVQHSARAGASPAFATRCATRRPGSLHRDATAIVRDGTDGYRRLVGPERRHGGGRRGRSSRRRSTQDGAHIEIMAPRRLRDGGLSGVTINLARRCRFRPVYDIRTRLSGTRIQRRASRRRRMCGRCRALRARDHDA